MPDDDGFILQMSRIDDSGEYGRLFLWRDGAVAVLLAEMSPRINWLPLFFVLPTVQQERRLFFSENLFGDSGDGTVYWLDLQTCPGPLCQLQTGGDALPDWSPDETQTLLVRFGADGRLTLALGDDAGLETAAIGPGWSPIWAADDAFAYVHPDPALDPAEWAANSMATEWVRAVVAETAVTEQVLLTSETLRRSLSEAERPAHLGIITAFPRPAQPGQWLIQATTAFNSVARQDYVFSFDETSGAIALLLPPDDFQGTPVQLVGNGRYLAAFTSQSYLLYDLDRGQTVAFDAPQTGFPHVNWSADGRWFVVIDEAGLRLVAPGSGYERPIFHGMDGCGTAVWVNR